MATPESYRPDESDSSPAPATLPQRPPDRFQFSVRSLLWFMFASAILAAGIHYAAKLFPPWPGQTDASIPVLWSLGAGALLYLFIRVPFLVFGGIRSTSRWQALQAHRRDLVRWSQERRKHRKRSQP